MVLSLAKRVSLIAQCGYWDRSHTRERDLFSLTCRISVQFNESNLSFIRNNKRSINIKDPFGSAFGIVKSVF